MRDLALQTGGKHNSEAKIQAHSERVGSEDHHHEA